jgi:hypothetical protein
VPELTVGGDRVLGMGRLALVRLRRRWAMSVALSLGIAVAVALTSAVSAKSAPPRVETRPIACVPEGISIDRCCQVRPSSREIQIHWSSARRSRPPSLKAGGLSENGLADGPKDHGAHVRPPSRLTDDQRMSVRSRASPGSPIEIAGVPAGSASSDSTR